MRKGSPSFRDVPALHMAWHLWGLGLVPDAPLQLNSTKKMLLHVLPEKSILLRRVASQLHLEEPKPQLVTWEGEETAAREQNWGGIHVNGGT